MLPFDPDLRADVVERVADVLTPHTVEARKLINRSR
jgi:hypothetical protein